MSVMFMVAGLMPSFERKVESKARELRELMYICMYLHPANHNNYFMKILETFKYENTRAKFKNTLVCR